VQTVDLVSSATLIFTRWAASVVVDPSLLAAWRDISTEHCAAIPASTSRCSRGGMGAELSTGKTIALGE
jgi:hypothetical protein